MAIKLKVNNHVRTVDVPPDTPLLWALRDVLDLKGAKYGCGIGVCGACTVLVAGHAVRSCITHVGSVGSDPITTIEGLADTEIHPVQQAWEELDVPNAATASRARSWLPLRSWPTRRIPLTPTSTAP